MNHETIKTSQSTKETTPFHIYKQDLSDALISDGNFDSEIFNSLSERVNSMYENMEPIWMAYSELSLRMSALRKDKVINEIYPSPLSLAKRVVYMD